MASTTPTLFDFGRALRVLGTRSVRGFAQVAAGYQHQARRECLEEKAPSQPLGSPPLSCCNDDWFHYKPVTGFQPPEAKSEYRPRRLSQSIILNTKNAGTTEPYGSDDVL